MTETEKPQDICDSIELGSPTKGGKLKVYGSADKPTEFKQKIDNMKEILAYANLGVKIGNV